MALESTDGDVDGRSAASLANEGQRDIPRTPTRDEHESEDAEEGDEDEDQDEDEDEDEEPKLKYARMTSSLGGLYRNGDATSTFIVAGDKMIIGTHNGNIHVLSLPSFQSLKFYHAHSASVTAISISPYPPPLPNPKADAAAIKAAAVKATAALQAQVAKNAAAPKSSAKSPKQHVIPATLSNSIYVATSSIDGNVCVASLIDGKDVLLRNFARPVQAVAISPDYKNDRSYLSGGLAGNLVLTVGGRVGVSSTSTTTRTAAAAASASGWLGSIGIGSNSGKDTILHSGEGTISTIKWSLSGNYVVWINEKGIKIMRSNLNLDSEELDYAWKRISHVDRPDGPRWDDMSAIWKGRAEWIDEDGLESNDTIWEPRGRSGNADVPSRPKEPGKRPLRGREEVEKLVVGWGGVVWIIDVYPGATGTGKDVGEKIPGRAEVVTLLRMDCIISGLTLYTPTLLIVLAYLEPKETTNPAESHSSPKRGVHHRKNALPPELRIIDITTSEEISTDSPTVSRYESLSVSDYHLSVLPSVRNAPSTDRQRGALEYVGGTIWSAGTYATGVFSSAGSVLAASTKSDGASEKSQKPPSNSSVGKTQPSFERVKVAHPAAGGPGMKIYINSPYDCILATKRDLGDHLVWLQSQAKYGEAWQLLTDHPEAMATPDEAQSDSTPSTPSKTRASSEDFFADNSSAKISENPQFSAVGKEKRRIGELWLQQLVDNKEWDVAGETSAKVLTTSPRWEHWFWVFAQENRIEEITPFIPTKQLSPPLPSLVYEVTLGHYITYDRLRLAELLDQWPTDLYDIASVTTTLKGKLKSGEVQEDSTEDGELGRDWRIFMEAMAKLYLADGRPRDALKCRIRLKDADIALNLIRDHHLVDSVSDDIPGLILIRVSKEQMETASISELRALTMEPIQLLVEEALHGVVRPDTVVAQLEEADYPLYQFFYLRALWQVDEIDRPGKTVKQIDSEGKASVEEFADLAVELFAEYDRALLLEFLKSSQSYTFEKASEICERRHYIPEQVYLLSKTGQTKRALFLIIDQLHDVSGAIAFAKQQDDPDLWNDFLDYSMDKPRFIRGLLEEVGTAIDPITLVKRIPEGLEIEGLKDGLGRMVKEYEIQYSISEGVARVLRGEVATSLDKMRTEQRRGIKFDVLSSPSDSSIPTLAGPLDLGKFEQDQVSEAGHCAKCSVIFPEDDKDTLIGFACGHIFHLSCLHDYEGNPMDSDALGLGKEEEYSSTSRSVGIKVTHARLIRIRLAKGCPIHTAKV